MCILLYTKYKRIVYNTIHMPSKQPALFAPEQKLLTELGERLRLARLRRHMSAALVAERAGISRMTLYRAEQGNTAVSLGTCLRILAVLKLEEDIAAVARDDRLGRRLQDMKLPPRRTVSKRNVS